jgi:HSP20 family protein
MAVRDLIPWSRGRDLTVRRGEESNPFLALHRDVNRLFDEAFRGFDLTPFRNDRWFDQAVGWPSIEVSETDKDVKVTAELPGLEEKDVQVVLASGVLTVKGERRTETENKDRLFTERYYGRFERHIPVNDVDQDKVSAAFKNGVLTVTLPRLPEIKSKVKRIAINDK